MSKVSKSIYIGFRAIRVYLVHQKIDMNTIVSKIATPETKNKKTHILASYIIVYFISIAILKRYYDG